MGSDLDFLETERIVSNCHESEKIEI